MAARELYLAAREKYPYVIFGMEIVEQYLAEGNKPDVWLLYDYVLSQGLADEIEE